MNTENKVISNEVWKQYKRKGLSEMRPYIKGEGQLKIRTLEGEHLANVSDWVIKGVANEFYPCKPDIFEKTYEPVD